MAEYDMKILIRFEFFGGGSAEVAEGGDDVVFQVIFRMNYDRKIDIHIYGMNCFVIFFNLICLPLIIP